MRAGRTWSRPWPGEPWRCAQRSSLGSEVAEEGQQVGVAAGAGLEDGHTGGGVGDEHRQQPVAGADVGQERLAGRGQVGDDLGRPGADVHGARFHRAILAPDPTGIARLR